jgi:hypothetical protein
MATSSHADAPRGMEFLYSSNRLNVATSRDEVHLRPGRLAYDIRGRMTIAAANATCKRVLQVPGNGVGHLVWRQLKSADWSFA